MALFDDVQRKVLDNGLEVLVREDHSTPVVALNFFVRVGSLNEDDAIAGWSHGIEHMLFKGTNRRGPGDIAREISNAGGETNAGTGYESTNYYIILPSENFETAVDIHADVLRNSTFDEHELEKERQVLIKENEMYRDRPSGFGHTWESLLAEAFTTHRYRRPIGGPDENLLRVGREDILRYKETYYVPNNITYVVVGDVKAEEVFRVLDQTLGSWPRRNLRADTSPPEPPQKAFRHREGEGDVEKSYVKIGFHIPTELHPDTDSILVLAHILGSGRSSRLYQRVREEKGLILSCSILETTGREPGYLVVEFSAEPEKVDEALVEVFRQILTFQVEPVTADELARTLRAVQSDTVYTLETMEGQAQMLGHYALLGDYRLAGAYLDRMARVSPQRIQDVARRYLNLEQSTVHRYGPDGKGAGSSGQIVYDRLRAAVADSVGRNDQRAGAGTAETAVLSATGRTRGEVEVVDLDTGARVLLQPDGRLPLVALSTCIPGGSGLESEEWAGLSRLAQSCMLKGAGGKSAAEIAEALDRMGARLRPVSTRDVSGFNLGMMRDEVEPALALFRTVLTRPDFPERAAARERDRTLAELAALRDDTVQFTVAEFYRLIFPDHAYGRPVLGTDSSLTRIGRNDLARWHRESYSPHHMVLSVVGDFDRDLMLRELESLTRDLPGKDGTDPVISPVSAPLKPVRNDHFKHVNQAVVVLGYPGGRLDSPDRYALDVWDSILSGMGNRLFTRLRDEQHLCYFTGAFVSSFRHGGAVGAYIGTGPEQVEKATAALIEELERTRQELPTGEESHRARNNLAGSYLVGMQTRMSWAGTYARDEVLGLGWGEALRYVEEIRGVTPDMVRACAQTYVNPSRLVVAVLRPSGDSVSVETVEAQ